MNKILLSTKDKDREETADECFMRLKNEGIPETEIEEALKKAEKVKSPILKTQKIIVKGQYYEVKDETKFDFRRRLKAEGIPETKITKLLESNKRTPIKTENVYNYDHLYPF